MSCRALLNLVKAAAQTFPLMLATIRLTPLTWNVIWDELTFSNDDFIFSTIDMVNHELKQL